MPKPEDRPLTFRRVAVSAACLLVTSLAHGQLLPASVEIANPNAVGSGARAMGQGNAFIAVADDATAASWNPGGLSQIERPELSLAWEYLHLAEQTDPDFGTTRLDFDDLNYASVVFPFFLGRNMVLSLSYFKMFRFDKEAEIPFLIPPNAPGGADRIRHLQP